MTVPFKQVSGSELKDVQSILVTETPGMKVSKEKAAKAAAEKKIDDKIKKDEELK